MLGFDVKCHSITSEGTIQLLQEDPCSGWNVICVGLRLLLALLLAWHRQMTEDGEGGREEGGRRVGERGLFLRFFSNCTQSQRQESLQDLMFCGSGRRRDSGKETEGVKKSGASVVKQILW